MAAISPEDRNADLDVKGHAIGEGNSQRWSDRALYARWVKLHPRGWLLDLRWNPRDSARNHVTIAIEHDPTEEDEVLATHPLPNAFILDYNPGGASLEEWQALDPAGWVRYREVCAAALVATTVAEGFALLAGTIDPQTMRAS